MVTNIDIWAPGGPKCMFRLSYPSILLSYYTGLVLAFLSHLSPAGPLCSRGYLSCVAFLLTAAHPSTV